ncbi:MAG: site-2 protease family protein [Clostridiales bacterium]|nr:site-2 protease family protein [Clostridiales bacterium]
MLLFCLGKTELRVHPGLFLVILFLAVTGRLGMLPLPLLALLLHEGAHAVCAARMGLPVYAVTLLPFGAEASIDTYAALPQAEAVYVLMGPLCSFTAAGLTTLLLHIFPTLESALLPFVQYNLFLGIFNLLPAYPADGGRLLRCLLSRHLRPRTAAGIAAALGLVLGAALLAVCVWQSAAGTHLWQLYMVSAFLLLAAAKEFVQLPHAQLAAMARRGETLARGEALRVHTIAAHEKTQARELLREMRPHCYNRVLVIDGRMRKIGELDENAILLGLGRLGAGAKISEILHTIY